jgi:hypothetical protein
MRGRPSKVDNMLHGLSDALVARYLNEEVTAGRRAGCEEWTEDDKGDILQRFGVPAFPPRLHYTASCIDQAYACMLNVAFPDLYRKCQCFICVYLIP